MLKDRPEKRFSHVVCVENRRGKKHAIINFLDHHQSANGSCQNKSESSTSKTKPMYLCTVLRKIQYNLNQLFSKIFSKEKVEFES